MTITTRISITTRTRALLQALRRGERPAAGSTIGRATFGTRGWTDDFAGCDVMEVGAWGQVLTPALFRGDREQDRARGQVGRGVEEMSDAGR